MIYYSRISAWDDPCSPGCPTRSYFCYQRVCQGEGKKVYRNKNLNHIFFKLFVFENVFLASSIVKSDSNFVKYIVKAKIVFNKRL